MKYGHFFSGLILLSLLVACGGSDDRIATTNSPKRQVFFDFFNDIRLEVAELEPRYSRLDGFTTQTKKFLENRTAQENLLGYNKGKGKQVGQNYVYYQVFTAQPEDTELEQKIETIIEQNMEKHAAGIGAPMN